jgi:ribose transport system ATP-binding protein
MEEIFRLADRATVLTSGRTVDTVDLGRATRADLVRMMIEGGQERTIERPPATAQPRVRLHVEGLRTRRLRGVNLDVCEGEILGLGGLRGQGQSELLHALFGAVPFSGRVTLSGRPVHFRHPRQAMRQGLAFVPGDRNSEGVLMVRSILENLMLPSWRRYGPLLRMAAAWRDALAAAQRLRLVMASLESPVSSLSGGNAQKVVLGKWLLREPQVLLLDDPTKGVDVGAKGEFYGILAGLRQEGVSIVLYSSDDEELIKLCDRVLVLHDGQIQAELAGERLTQSELVSASLATVRGAEGAGQAVQLGAPPGGAQ